MVTERTSSSPHLARQDCPLPLKLPIPARIPLLYVILGVLLAISVLPMYFYSVQIESMNRERLKTNEMLLQNTVTRSLADDISQHQEALHMMLANLSSSIQVMMLASPGGNDLRCLKYSSPLPKYPVLGDPGPGMTARPANLRFSNFRV